MKAMYDRLTAIAAANPSVDAPLDMKPVPLTITAPAVTLPAVVTGTRTFPNADGSTSTETVKEETKVTPVIGTPSTVANPNIKYPTTTTVTTTTVNNVTNKTETVTNVINKPGDQAKPADLKIPDDYNREATQKEILRSLSGEGMPTADPATALEPAVADVAAQNKTGMDAVNSIDAGSVGLVDWFPKIPTAACRNPQVPQPLTGAMVTVEICEPVRIFSAFFNGVVAVFCLYGCIAQVTAAMKT